MQQTSLLFIPFPHSNGSTSDTNSFNQLFQSEAPQIMELSRTTKIKGGSLSSFRPYIRTLSTRRGSQIRSVWSDPFNQNYSIPSIAIESEIAATIWNYIGNIHVKILQADSSNIESLKKMRGELEEINACNAAFEDILSIIQHPFLNTHLAHFMKLYQNYICSYWQLSCISASKKNDFIPKASCRCIEDIKACEKYCSQLNPSANNYMLPAIQLIRSYLEGYANYILSFSSISRFQYGEAISYLQNGIEIVKSRKNQNARSAISINTANQFILNALTDKYNELKRKNDDVYHDRVPDTPRLPDPCAPPVVVLASPLLCLPNEIIQTNAQIPNINNSYSTMSNIPNPNPSQTPNYETYGQTNPIPFPYSNQPNAPPSIPTVNYPSIAPAPLPNPQPSVPTKKSQSPKKSSESINTKEWEIVCALKKELLPRIQKAMNNNDQNVSNVARSLFSQFQAASEIDIKIQESINNFQSNPSITADSINPYIKQADVFYTQLEERLNILEVKKK